MTFFRSGLLDSAGCHLQIFQTNFQTNLQTFKQTFKLSNQLSNQPSNFQQQGLKKWPGKWLPGKTPREMASRNDPQGMACQNAADLERRVAVRRTCRGTWFLLFSPRDHKAPGLKENCDGLVSNPRFSHERISFKVY